MEVAGLVGVVAPWRLRPGSLFHGRQGTSAMWMTPLLADVLKAETETRRFRLLALVLALSSMYFRDEDIAVIPPVVAALLFIGYTLALGPLLARLAPWLAERSTLVIFVLAVVAVDAAAVMVLVRLTGGVGSITVILVPLFIIYHCSYVGYSSGLLSATLFSALYLGFAFGEGATEGLGAAQVGQVALFYLVTVFSNYYIRRMFQAQRSNDALQAVILSAGNLPGLRFSSVDYSEGVVVLHCLATDRQVIDKFMGALHQTGRFATLRAGHLGPRRRFPLLSRYTTDGFVAGGVRDGGEAC